MRLRQILQFLKRDEAFYTLNLTFLNVTIGFITLAVGMWFAVALAGNQALRNGANEVAYAAEAQVQQSVSSTDGGYESTTWSLDSNTANTVGQSSLQQVIQNGNLSEAFDNLQATVTVSGTEVVVTMSGDYKPTFLQGLFNTIPALASVGEIPMKKTVQEQFYVANQQ